MCCAVSNSWGRGPFLIVLSVRSCLGFSLLGNLRGCFLVYSWDWTHVQVCSECMFCFWLWMQSWVLVLHMHVYTLASQGLLPSLLPSLIKLNCWNDFVFFHKWHCIQCHMHAVADKIVGHCGWQRSCFKTGGIYIIALCSYNSFQLVELGHRRQFLVTSLDLMWAGGL